MHKISNRIFEIFFKKTLDFLLAGFRYLTAFETLHPEMAHYLDMKYEEVQYGKIYG